jgi:hypothetical protein
MVIRRLACEARPNQQLQQTSDAQTAFVPRPPLIRGAVTRGNIEKATARRHISLQASQGHKYNKEKGEHR